MNFSVTANHEFDSLLGIFICEYCDLQILNSFLHSVKIPECNSGIQDCNESNILMYSRKHRLNICE